MNGDFALALFDPRLDQLLLVRDVMGPGRLHYMPAGRHALVRVRSQLVAGSPGVSAVPDEDGIADLVLDSGRRPPDVLQRYLLVPPGHCSSQRPTACRFDHIRGSIRLEKYGIDRIDEYVECFRTLFEQAVRRRMRSAGSGPIAVSVSGGVDSSSIFCQASALKAAMEKHRRARYLDGISGGHRRGRAEFLDEIDRAYGTRITRLPVSEVRFLADADKVVGHLEMPAVFWDAYGEMFETARRAGCSVILDGYFGDQMLFGQGYSSISPVAGVG